ncbi:MAG TPA: protein-L-isoaspartate(D-aspartate) O-methyltransferase [Candidatus Thermoplasmatota archaeon]|nr:protein-L-isoaspartate(D-aspartate) O-methyltransferase [Candidatus Thermoplasmatota archaeon]
MYEAERNRLISTLVSEGYIKTEPVRSAFCQIPREGFVPEYLKKYAYADTPLDIGEGQTISAPHMVAIMCEALDVQAGQKILEIGTGSGYHAAVVAAIVGTTGHVYSIERRASLAKQAKEHIKNTGITNVTVEIGDGSEGLGLYQPYDRIYVTAASPRIPPPLVDQLRDPGKLLVPIGDMYCELTLLEKKGGTTKTRTLGGCVFVPLVGKYGH